VWGIKRNCPNGFAVSELKIAIILGSTRPGRNGKAVADWVFDKAQARIGADYDLIDLSSIPSPHRRGPPAQHGPVRRRAHQAWAATIPLRRVHLRHARVHPLHVRALKNTIDYLYAAGHHRPCFSTI
jgi:NADPH-dependent FMN reductase